MSDKLNPCPECGKGKAEDALWCVHCGSIKTWRMVCFMVTAGIASIPAIIILGLIGFAGAMIIGLMHMKP